MLFGSLDWLQLCTYIHLNGCFTTHTCWYITSVDIVAIWSSTGSVLAHHIPLQLSSMLQGVALFAVAQVINDLAE